jgi:hypothetical protein
MSSAYSTTDCLRIQHGGLRAAERVSLAASRNHHHEDSARPHAWRPYHRDILEDMRACTCKLQYMACSLLPALVQLLCPRFGLAILFAEQQVRQTQHNAHPRHDHEEQESEIDSWLWLHLGASLSKDSSAAMQHIVACLHIYADVKRSRVCSSLTRPPASHHIMSTRAARCMHGQSCGKHVCVPVFGVVFLVREE